MTHPELTCSVKVSYLDEQSQPSASVFAFAYTITIVNSGDVTSQLMARHWVITDAQGHTDEVRGLAVVGHQPLLKPGVSLCIGWCNIPISLPVFYLGSLSLLSLLILRNRSNCSIITFPVLFTLN